MLRAAHNTRILPIHPSASFRSGRRWCRKHCVRACQATHSQTVTAQAADTNDNEPTFAAHIISSIHKVPAAEWDKLALHSSEGEVVPFISHAFLSALEDSGSASTDTGWTPCHLILRLTQQPPAAAQGGENDHTGAQQQQQQQAVEEQAEEETEDVGIMVAAVPMYIKAHSYGEFVFDSTWAELASMVGERYYPKLQICVPFTPVTCPRLLTWSPPGSGLTRAQLLRVLGRTLIRVADKLGVSGVHVTFNTDEEAAALEEVGWATRTGVQFHWDNHCIQPDDGASAAQDQPAAGQQQQQQHRLYTSFEHFLSCLKQGKRKSIRQERKAVANSGLRVRRLTGAALRAEGSTLWDRVHELYVDTVDRKWGNAFLTQDFFRRLGSQLSEQVLLVVAEEPATPPEDTAQDLTPPPDSSSSSSSSEAGSWRLIAASLNIIGSNTLYGRNWACDSDAEYKHLHFELCYYQAQEEAIARRMPRVEAGAQGMHKLQRGYLPQLTYSSHYVMHPALSMAVEKMVGREQGHVLQALTELTLEASPYKAGHTTAHLVDKLTRVLRGSSASVAARLATSLSSAEEEQLQNLTALEAARPQAEVEDVAA